MTNPDTTTTLWAVHVQGPDEYIAAESREAADAIKAQFDHFDTVNERRTNFPKASAVVVEWPWDVASHALAIETEETYSSDGIPEPCQPIGCDAGHHLPGCVFASADCEDPWHSAPGETAPAEPCATCGACGTEG